MEEEFDERISEFSQITGSVIKGFSEKRESLQHSVNLEEMVKKVFYMLWVRDVDLIYPQKNRISVRL